MVEMASATRQGKQSDGGATQDCGDSDGGLKGPPWTCVICDQAVPSREKGKQLATTRRIFPNKGALLAHQRAKHFGVHLNIKPDWHRQNNGGDGGSATRWNSCHLLRQSRGRWYGGLRTAAQNA
jgi:hypothetical protein